MIKYRLTIQNSSGLVILWTHYREPPQILHPNRYYVTNYIHYIPVTHVEPESEISYHENSIYKNWNRNPIRSASKFWLGQTELDVYRAIELEDTGLQMIGTKKQDQPVYKALADNLLQLLNWLQCWQHFSQFIQRLFYDATVWETENNTDEVR